MATPHIRDVTIGEPIAKLEVGQDDTFFLDLNLFDDQGAAWSDGYTCNLFLFMSNQDIYSGSTPNFFATFSGTTSGGTASMHITTSGTSLPGDYRCEIVISGSGSGSNAEEITAGEFDFSVIGD